MHIQTILCECHPSEKLNPFQYCSAFPSVNGINLVKPSWKMTRDGKDEKWLKQNNDGNGDNDDCYEKKKKKQCSSGYGGITSKKYQ